MTDIEKLAAAAKAEIAEGRNPKQLNEEERKSLREELKQAKIQEPKKEDLMALLEEAIKYEGTASAVAYKTGYSKVTISLIRNGKYYGGHKVFYARLKRAYNFLSNGVIMCPGLKGEIHIQVCKQYREAVRDGKILKGAAFVQAKAMCPYCPIGDKND
jgi:hypothetical protein